MMWKQVRNIICRKNTSANYMILIRQKLHCSLRRWILPSDIYYCSYVRDCRYLYNGMRLLYCSGEQTLFEADINTLPHRIRISSESLDVVQNNNHPTINWPKHVGILQLFERKPRTILEIFNQAAGRRTVKFQNNNIHIVVVLLSTTYVVSTYNFFPGALQ